MDLTTRIKKAYHKAYHELVSPSGEPPQTKEVRLLATAENNLQTSDKNSGDPQSIKDQFGIPTISPSELEATFKNDGVVFNSLTKTVAIIMSAKTDTDKPYFFEGNRKSVKFFENFYENIGNIGKQTDDLTYFKRVWLDQFIGGEHYAENIHNKKGDEIVDVDTLDPKKLSPAMDTRGRIVIDKNNNPIGFVSRDPTQMRMSGKFKPPNLVDFHQGDVFYPPEYISFNKLLALGDGQRGTGLIEPVYSTVKYKFNIEDAFAQSWLRVGQPIPVGFVGNEQNMPTEKRLKEMLEELEGMNTKSAMAIPWYNKVELLEPKRRFSIRDDLNHFVDGTTAGLGMPSVLALGRGDIDKAVIGTLKHFLEITLENTVRQTLRTIERQQINVIVDLHNKAHPKDKISPVKIRWGQFSLEELNSKADRLFKYAQAGFITPGPEIEKEIRKLEGLPPRPKGAPDPLIEKVETKKPPKKPEQNGG